MKAIKVSPSGHLILCEFNPHESIVKYFGCPYCTNVRPQCTINTKLLVLVHATYTIYFVVNDHVCKSSSLSNLFTHELLGYDTKSYSNCIYVVKPGQDCEALDVQMLTEYLVNTQARYGDAGGQCAII